MNQWLVLVFHSFGGVKITPNLVVNRIETEEFYVCVCVCVLYRACGWKWTQKKVMAAVFSESINSNLWYSHSLYKNIYFPATVVALAGIICVYLVSSQTIFPSFTAIVPFPWWCLRKRLCSFYHITKHHKIVTVIWWETMTKIQPFSGFLHKTHIIRIVFCRVSTDVNAVPLQHAHTHTDTHIGAYFEQFFRRPKEFLVPFIRLSFIH